MGYVWVFRYYPRTVYPCDGILRLGQETNAGMLFIVSSIPNRIVSVYMVLCWPGSDVLLGPLDVYMDKMATIRQMIFSYAFLWMKNFVLWWEIHRSFFFHKSSIDNNPALIQIMAWRCTGDQPLSWPSWHNSLMHIGSTWGRRIKILLNVLYTCVFCCNASKCFETKTAVKTNFFSHLMFIPFDSLKFVLSSSSSSGIKILGAVSIRKTVLPGMAIPMLKIRRPNGRLIFNMENAIRR